MIENEWPVLSETDKAWVAGFMDGEGCFAISRSERKNRPSRTYKAYISACNTVKAPIDFLFASYPGRILELHSPTMRRDGLATWSVRYEWRSTVYGAKKFILDILPYLRVKKRQAELIVQFLDTKEAFARSVYRPGTRGGSAPMTPEEQSKRDNLFLEVRMLNARWDLAHAPNAKERIAEEHGISI